MITPQPASDSPKGLAYAILTYGMWGFLPLYMHLLVTVSSFEIIAHRVLWSLPVAGAVLWWQGRAGDVLAAFRQPRLLAMAGLTASLVTVNWLIYVWAVTSGHALDAALGYYINPLFSVFLGATLLGERLTRAQIAAILLAAAAVILLTIQLGRLPLPALGLTVSWGLYAYFKKSLPLEPNQGFMLEVLLLAPLAAIGLAWQAGAGQPHFRVPPDLVSLLLIGCGPATAIPLMFYANAAKLLRLSTIGILQYITPTMIFLCAVLFLDEPMGTARMIAFPMIWAALLIYSVSLLRGARGQRRRQALANAREQ